VRGRHDDQQTSGSQLEQSRRHNKKRHDAQVRRGEVTRITYRPAFPLVVFAFCREALFDEKTGRVKRAGETYRFPKLAETMRIIAKEGADAIYNGSLTRRLIADLNNVNGIITEEDLANYEWAFYSECRLTRDVYPTYVFVGDVTNPGFRGRIGPNR